MRIPLEQYRAVAVGLMDAGEEILGPDYSITVIARHRDTELDRDIVSTNDDLAETCRKVMA